MAHFHPQYKRDVRSTVDLNLSTLQTILERHYDAGLEVTDFKFDGKFGEGANANANSDLKGLWVTIKRQSGEKEKIHIIVKTPFALGFFRAASKILDPFFRESLWYGVIAPELSKHFPEVAALVPGCYYSNCNRFGIQVPSKTQSLCCILCWGPCKRSEEGIILLENMCLRPEQYRVLDKYTPMDLPHSLLTMRSLAHFHGAWFKILHGLDDGEEYSHLFPFSSVELKRALKIRLPLIALKPMINAVGKAVVKLLQKTEAEELVNRVSRFYQDDAYPTFRDGYQFSNSRIMTVCHGDMWSNNLMFSYDSNSNDSLPKSMKILDYQLMFIGHPARDIFFYAYISTDHIFRKAHMNDLLNEYFDVYSNYIRDVVPSYTIKDFMDECKMFQKFGQMSSIQILPNMLSPIQMHPDLSNSEYRRKVANELVGTTKELQDMPELKEVRRRIIGIVREMDEQGHLPGKKTKQNDTEIGTDNISNQI